MPLLVSLTRPAEKHDLGSHEALELSYDELRVSGGSRLAGHRHNRWIAESADPFSHLEIEGPLTVTAPNPGERVLGPYMRLSMYDGVAYVDGRVFAFTDVQQRDWYLHDVGKHWPCMKIVFHATGP